MPHIETYIYLTCILFLKVLKMASNIRKEITTIVISKQTRSQLAALGRKADTYDDIIVKLIKHWDASAG